MRSTLEAPQQRDITPTLRRPQPHRRIRTLMIVTAIIVSLYAARLVELQVLRGSDLEGLALADRTSTMALPATRGQILDASGNPLAVSVDAVTVTVDQIRIVDPKATAQALSPLLKKPVADLVPLLDGEKRYVVLARQIEPRVWNEISALRLPGIYSERTSKRVYPAGNLAATIVGFVGVDGHGLGGLEYSLESTLAGVDGERTYERAPDGRRLPTGEQQITPAIPGTSVMLTINRDIQWIAERALAERVKFANADSGSVVVMDPRTGDILALATWPTFNPNNPTAASVSQRNNIALTEVFEPGSVAKVMSLAAVLEEGKATVNSKFKVPNRLKRGPKSFKDHEDHPTLRLTLTGVMAQSSNIGTILASERIGGETLHSYLRKFGIGEPTGLNFPGEGKGLLRSLDNWSVTTFPTLTFGQGMSVNAVQNATAFATIANGGVRMPARLVQATQTPSGDIQQVPVGTGVRVVSEKTAADVTMMLERVVSPDGTGMAAAIPGYRVAGKTGTAQRYEPSCGCYGGYVANFIGMVPADDPRLVISVSLNNPRNGHYGGMHGGPVFAEVGTFALQELRIAPSKGKAPTTPTTW